MQRPRIFVCYSHDDEEWRRRLCKHLKLLETCCSPVEVWSDRKITTGGTWADEIRAALENSEVAVCLISASFLASDFCQKVEIPRLLERRRNGLLLVPVLVSDCAWQCAEWLKDIQMHPRDEKTIVRDFSTTFDDVFADVARSIADHLNKITSEIIGAGSKPFSKAGAKSRVEAWGWYQIAQRWDAMLEPDMYPDAFDEVKESLFDFTLAWFIGQRIQASIAEELAMVTVQWIVGLVDEFTFDREALPIRKKCLEIAAEVMACREIEVGSSSPDTDGLMLAIPWAIRLLKPNSQRVLRLASTVSFDPVRIAKSLGISVDEAAVQVQSALQELRRVLENDLRDSRESP